MTESSERPFDLHPEDATSEPSSDEPPPNEFSIAPGNTSFGSSVCSSESDVCDEFHSLSSSGFGSLEYTSKIMHAALIGELGHENPGDFISGIPSPPTLGDAHDLASLAISVGGIKKGSAGEIVKSPRMAASVSPSLLRDSCKGPVEKEETPPPDPHQPALDKASSGNEDTDVEDPRLW